MANGPIYRVALRRRREGKTNYHRRRELLKSDHMRLIIRRSTKNMRVQLIEAHPDGDKTKVYASSKQLVNHGWTVSGGNIPAAYLTGYLAGKKAVNAGISSAILDLGLQRNSVGSRIYAALKGVIDAGVEVPANDKIFPPEDVLMGSHIKAISSNIKAEDKKDFTSRYAKYQKSKVDPEKLDKLVKSTMEAIDKLK